MTTLLFWEGSRFRSHVKLQECALQTMINCRSRVPLFWIILFEKVLCDPLILSQCWEAEKKGFHEECHWTLSGRVVYSISSILYGYSMFEFAFMHSTRFLILNIIFFFHSLLIYRKFCFHLFDHCKWKKIVGFLWKTCIHLDDLLNNFDTANNEQTAT